MVASGPLDAVVIGSGPNGLAAAVTLARSGLAVQVLEAQPTPGGGARTEPPDGPFPSVAHDLCAAVLPMASASGFFRRFDLAARGVDLLVPEISFAHPLGDRPAALAHRSLERTASGLGADGAAWLALFGPLADHAPDVVSFALGDRRSLPEPAATALLAWRSLWLGVGAPGRGSGGRRGRAGSLGGAGSALFAGLAAHLGSPLPSPVAAGAALLLGTLAHTTGWPVPRGGAQAVTDALLADLEAHGGIVVCDHPVRRASDLPPARAYVFDTAPEVVARVMGDRLPARVRRALTRPLPGGGAAKVDLVLSGPVPWRDPDVGRAGTVHLGGRWEQIATAERQVARGRLPDRPVVLLSDPTVVDPGRIVEGLRPLWTYVHVPRGCPVDVTDRVVAAVEREAPGFRDVVVAARCTPADRMAEHNANLVGGHIAAGAVTAGRLVLGPVPAWDPYTLPTAGPPAGRPGSPPAPGVYLCSASVPPGAGVHGMSGWHAARRVLRDAGIAGPPSLRP